MDQTAWLADEEREPMSESCGRRMACNGEQA